MTLMVNGQAEALPDPATVQGLVLMLKLDGQRLAVEHNGQIVPRSLWQQTALQAGDHIEIVKAIGGG
jgi:sulfur carrier protein